MKETHPFQVRVWLPGIDTKYGLASARWSEMCRCQTQERAKKIAEALHYTSNMLYAVVSFNNEKKIGVNYLSYHPDQERALREGAIDPPIEAPTP